MSRSRKKNMVSLPLLTGLLSCSAYSIYAQSASENYSLITGYGGQFLGQGNAAVNGSQALKNVSCAPTAVANGLSWLQAYGYSTDSSPLGANPNNYATVNTLQTSFNTTVANASQDPSILAGTQAWLANNPGTAPVNVVQTYIPSSQYLANVLNANDAVQLGISWAAAPIANNSSFTPNNGGHFVSLDSINLNPSGNGTIGILDPWGDGTDNGAGGYNAGTVGTQETLTVTRLNIVAGGVNSIAPGTYLEITDPSPLGDFPQLPAGTGYAGADGIGLIDLAQIETLTAVPEPSSLVISGLASAGIGGFVLLRRRKV